MLTVFWSWFTARAVAFLALLTAVLAAIGGIYLKGRSEGKRAERQRARKAVDTVQKEMGREMQKPVSGDEVIEKLERGKF